jgi:alkylation response protein AidB-like acyl-CoA dehydrogenase
MPPVTAFAAAPFHGAQRLGGRRRARQRGTVDAEPLHHRRQLLRRIRMGAHQPPQVAGRDASVGERPIELAPLLQGGELATASLFNGGPAAQEVSGKVRLSGLAQAVASADRASHVLVSTAQHVILAPLKQAGVKIVARPTWDVTRRLFDVHFADFDVPDAWILARGPAAQSLARTLATHRDFALAADSVGGASALLDLTVEYLKTRRQFGRPLAMFQALKHRCADLKALTAAAEALLLENLGKAQHSCDAEAEVLGKQAKSLACSVYFRVAEEAVQLHGGIGMTSEHVCHRFLKRALLNAQLGRPNGSYDLDIAADTLDGL